MQKILSLAAVAITSISFSNAAYADSAGCGLGSMLLNGNKGAPSNVMAVTTNGSFGNQTFGISSGTLGCDKNDYVRSSVRFSFFANKNLNELAQDTAKGNGEYLEAAAQILEIKEADKAHFFSVMQNNFSNIFSNENVNSEEVVASISKVMKSDEVLKTYEI